MASHQITTAKNIDELVKLGSVTLLAWSSSGTTVSITQANHSYKIGDPFYVPTVAVSTGAAGLTTGAKLVLGITSSSVFTVTGTSNTGTGTCTVIPHETYDINGGTLTIDQDTRVGLNANVNAGMGPITISPTLGGTCNIDGSAIWMIPYTGGSGNVPAWNTAITNGTGTGKLTGVFASLTAASTATGAAMPATGFIRVKQKSGAYQAGTLTGITATAGDAGRIGWMELIGIESFTVNANRLGTFNVIGAWYAVGTTNGTSNQTMQIPSNGLLRHIAGVFIEKSVGSDDYEFYPNAGTTTTTGVEATRGKVVWIDNAGLVRIGNSGAATNGYTPVTGLKVVVGNVFLTNATAAAPTANVIPNSTIATRYDFTTIGGGVVVMDKCDCQWYPSFSQAFSVTLSNMGIAETLLLAEIATPITITKVGVGQKATTQLATNALNTTYCYAGGTFTDCVWSRCTLAASPVNTLTDVSGFTFVRDRIQNLTITGANVMMAIIATRASNCTWITPTIIQGAINLITCDNINVNDTIYCNAVQSTTVTTYTNYIFNLSSATKNCTFSGLTFPVTNTHPYTAILIAATGCSNIKLRNIGTRVAPLTFGSANACGLIYTLGTNCQNFKFQRIYVSNTRTGIMAGDNSCKNITEENVWGDYADAVDVMAVLNLKRKGMGGTGALTAQTSVYGTHFYDSFTSVTAGRIAILMNEANSLTTSQVTLTNGAAFTSVGGLYMPVIGMTATFETPEYILGHTAFSGTAVAMTGGTIANYRFEYSIDKNDGNGWSALSASAYTGALLATALAAITGIDAALGFKLRIKVSTTTTNATAITSLLILTVSTTTAQDYQYPLDTATVTVSGLVTGSRVKASKVSNGTVLANSAETAGVMSFVTDYIGAINIEARKASASSYYIPWVTQVTTVANTISTAIALQQLDE